MSCLVSLNTFCPVLSPGSYSFPRLSSSSLSLSYCEWKCLCCDVTSWRIEMVRQCFCSPWASLCFLCLSRVSALRKTNPPEWANVTTWVIDGEPPLSSDEDRGLPASVRQYRRPGLSSGLITVTLPRLHREARGMQGQRSTSCWGLDNTVNTHTHTPQNSN